MASKEFVNKVLALSETKDEKELPTEWDIIDINNIPKYSEQINKCLCGRPIAEIFVMQDLKNGNKTNVGSGCVNVFLNIPLDVFRAVQRIVIDPDDTIPKRILKWALDIHWITEEEFEFYNSLHKRKDLTDEDWERKEDINTKIANCADETKFYTKDAVRSLSQEKSDAADTDVEHEHHPHRKAIESPTVILNDTIEEPVLERIDVDKITSLVLVNYAYRVGWITPRQHNSYLLIYRYAQKHELDTRRQERVTKINTLINIGIYAHKVKLMEEADRAAQQYENDRQARAKAAYDVACTAGTQGNIPLFESATKEFYRNIYIQELPIYLQTFAKMFDTSI